MKVTATHVNKVSKWLDETDPEKLHAEAAKLMSQLKILAGREDVGESLMVMYNATIFLETRAIYLLLARLARRANVL